MFWYRSWPSPTDWAANNLDTYPHIIDRLPRMLMAGQNYKTVFELNSLQTANGWPDDKPGFCMLEWDIALDPIGQQIFASTAWEEPRQILVAPYRFHDTWVNWIGNDGSGPSPSELGGRPVQQGEELTDSFGLGCIYIPKGILLEFLGQMDKFGFTDGTFGKWYHERYGQARITWKVHPQHIHDYQIT